jgi:tripartite-type tricarboxylate transporter receptor subunit TctC
MLLPRLMLSIVSIIALVNGAATFAQPNLNKPIRLVTSAPGGGADGAARLIAHSLTSTSSQLVIVENRSGGLVPPGIVLKATPDGTTLLVYTSSLWITPLIEKTPYDVMRDFAPVMLAASSPNIIVVHPSLAANSVKELIALAKAKPGALNYNSGGTGTASHIAVELFKSMAGVNIARIPYKSTGPALIDLMGGRADVMFPTVLAGLSYVKSGRLRALAVTTAQPSVLAPGLPTVAASGLPSYESVAVIGLLAPAGTSQAILNRLNLQFATALNNAEIKEKFVSTGSEVIANSPAQFLAFIKSDIARLGKVIRDAGITGD